MLKNIRILLGSVLFNVFFVVFTLFWGIFLPIAMLSTKYAQYLGYLWSVIILTALKFFCNITHSIEGKDNISKESCIIASKHESTWDTIFLLNLLYDPIFILKRELMYFPVYGQYLFFMQMIHINRSKGKKSLDEISKKSKKLIHTNRKIVVFPQGTRTKPEEKKRYKSGIYNIATTTGLKIIPVTLNSGKFWKKNAFLKYPGVIKVKILNPITTDSDRKTFMASLENEIESHKQNL